MIYLNSDLDEPLYLQLREQLKREIIIGNYQTGSRLPPVRQIAKQLCISRNTVVNAYEQLRIEGYVTSKQRSGYIVENIQNGVLDPPYKTIAKLTENASMQLGDEETDIATPCTYDFQYGNLSADLFPTSLWRSLTSDALDSITTKQIVTYGDKQGEHALRREISQYLNRSRGICCSLSQIVLCSGHQEALNLICTLFDGEERSVAIEDPSYDLTRRVFKNNRYHITSIPVKESGIDLSELEKSRAKMVYITPSHQFPLGMIMPIKHRMKLLQWAKETDNIILEDDYDSELRYDTHPIPSLHSMDQNERVVYFGTFSKALSPALRMNYVILPTWLVQKYQTTFHDYKPTVPCLQQKVMTLFMENGHWERHLRKTCLRHKKKHDVLIRSIYEQMGDKVRILGGQAGLHILLEVLNKEPQESLIERAAAHQVKVYPTREYWNSPDKKADNLVLLGFSSIDELEIATGVNLLAKAWF